ncbi:hypothetical protein TNCV_2681271 [Trichonephila clavipes]|uniref:Uncharacterized protein n=1 Tax=Trichonephila clavipes TaxID=2585209 RepID=A0A8X6V671_TRICX|nr:hypothetical protein TNCV_2681271 [Trichonephila clavipes]
MLHFQTLAWIIISSFSFVISVDKDFYRAAVLELAQFTNISYPAADILRINLEVYEIAAKTAAKHGIEQNCFHNDESIFKLSPNDQGRRVWRCPRPRWDTHPTDVTT